MCITFYKFYAKDIEIESLLDSEWAICSTKFFKKGENYEKEVISYYVSTLFSTQCIRRLYAC